MNYWFCSDLHLGHFNILRYSNRPFFSKEEKELLEKADKLGKNDIPIEMQNAISKIKREVTEQHDEALIQNWNNCVKPGDEAYFLGDFTFSRERAMEYRRRLNGTIFFIEGNHDKPAFQIRESFSWYRQVREVRVNSQDIFLSHYAHRVWSSSHHGVWHLYGHSHNSLPDDPNSMSFDVGIDATANRLAGFPTGGVFDGTKPADYRPMSFDEVKAVMAKKTFKPIDHHGARSHEKRS